MVLSIKAYLPDNLMILLTSPMLFHILTHTYPTYGNINYARHNKLTTINTHPSGLVHEI